MFRPRPLLAGLVSALVAAALGGCSLGDEPSTPPQLGGTSGEQDAATKLGFPRGATKNTIRIAGEDAVADVAGAVNAVFPGRTEDDRPNAVVLVDKGDWQGAVAAAVLMANPIEAPTLLSDGDELPDESRDTLARLDPRGSDLSKDAQVIRIGDRPPRPEGRRTALIQGADPYERAAAIDRFISTAKGEPSGNVVLASGEQPQFAAPAAAWAARSGDSVLLTRRASLPPSTRKALQEHEKPNIYVLGPPAVIAPSLERELEALGKVTRIQGRTPVQNAIEFARFQRGGFGWGIVVPGYNFAIANVGRPLDAAAAAPLATKGIFAPLLLTDQAASLPRALESYLLDVQPGFEDDPRQAVYNRVWILGNETALSQQAQARIDRITELIPVQANPP